MYINPNTNLNQILTLTIKKLRFKKYKIGVVGIRTPNYGMKDVTLPTRPQHKNKEFVFENGIYVLNASNLIYMSYDVMVRLLDMI